MRCHKPFSTQTVNYTPPSMCSSHTHTHGQQLPKCPNLQQHLVLPLHLIFLHNLALVIRPHRYLPSGPSSSLHSFSPPSHILQYACALARHAWPVTRQCIVREWVVRQCVVTMRRQGVMHRQGAMRRQGMCHHNVSSQCVVRGSCIVRGQCVVRECVITMCRQELMRRQGKCRHNASSGANAS